MDSWSVLFFWCFLVVYENLFGYVCLYGYVVGNLFLVMYVYMHMLDFVELCCWIYMLDLMKYVVGHAVGYVGYVCMYICV